MTNHKTKHFFTELISGKWFPLLLIAVMACTYAIQIPQLGFYLDDWVSIAAYDQGGEKGLLAGRVHEDLTEQGELSQAWKGHCLSLGRDEGRIFQG